MFNENPQKSIEWKSIKIFFSIHSKIKIACGKCKEVPKPQCNVTKNSYNWIGRFLLKTQIKIISIFHFIDKNYFFFVIVGGSGFLGQHIVRLIQEEQFINVKEIRVVDLKAYENRLSKDNTL